MKRFIPGLLLCVSFAFPATTQAVIVRWDVDDGLWQTPTHWADGAVPVGDDIVYIDNGGIARIDTDTGRTPVSGTLNKAWDGGVVNGSVVQTGSDVKFGNWAVGVGATGGTYEISDGTLNVGNQLQVGRGGASHDAISEIKQTGGTITADKFLLGNGGTASDSTYTIEGGSFNLRWNFVIASGNEAANIRAIFNQSGGTFNTYRQMELGPGAGADGWAIFNLTGGEMVIRNELSSAGIDPIVFTPQVGDVYANIAGGTLKLQGEWDFSSLTGIADSDFRSYDLPATEENLLFAPITMYNMPYTAVTAVYIEPQVTDINGDGIVDDKDLNLVLSDFVPSGGTEYEQTDLAAVLTDFGSEGTPPQLSGNAVPEPTSLALLLAACGIVPLLRRKKQ